MDRRPGSAFRILGAGVTATAAPGSSPPDAVNPPREAPKARKGWPRRPRSSTRFAPGPGPSGLVGTPTRPPRGYRAPTTKAPLQKCGRIRRYEFVLGVVKTIKAGMGQKAGHEKRASWKAAVSGNQASGCDPRRSSGVNDNHCRLVGVFGTNDAFNHDIAAERSRGSDLPIGGGQRAWATLTRAGPVPIPGNIAPPVFAGPTALPRFHP